MAEANLIKKDDLARAREIDFVYRFVDGIKKLVEALGVTRKIPKVSGTTLKAYKATGTLQDGSVPEGDLIPLSHYKTEPITFAEIELKKWRKATTAEAIVEKGYNQAVIMTNEQMIKDVQKGIKKSFFDFLKTGTGVAAGANFQSTLAAIWGQLQVLFEDTDFEAVYFMNPLDAADYLGAAPISMQTVFGMSYIENFLGLGTVIFNSAVPKGKIYGTAKENLILYYIPVNGAGLENAFQFTSDELGYIGITEIPDYKYMTTENVVTSGLVLFAERIDGVVVGTIGDEDANPSIELNKTAVTIAVDGTTDITATTVPADASVTWTSSDTAVATVADGTVTGVAEGTATITAKITVDGTDYTATSEVTVSAGA